IRSKDGIASESFDLVYTFDSSTRRGRAKLPELGEAAFLRLKREGSQVAAAYSRDGKEWSEIFPDGVDWKGPIKVGVYAKNMWGEEFTAVFDQYTLTQPKK